MARQEQDREDILREATALVERAELRFEGDAAPVVVGFRRDGSASFFFGSEHVFQFNSAKQLRRGYVQGQLLKAERGRLVSLERERTPDEVVLRRRDLSVEETTRTLALVRENLAELADRIDGQTYTTLAQVPAGADIVGRIGIWLTALDGRIQVARRPHAG